MKQPTRPGIAVAWSLTIFVFALLLPWFLSNYRALEGPRHPRMAAEQIAGRYDPVGPDLLLESHTQDSWRERSYTFYDASYDQRLRVQVRGFLGLGWQETRYQRLKRVADVTQACSMRAASPHR